ncbi:MAG: UvrB/UvrC motif-containing protein [Symbiobacteriia bacterium]
MLCQECNKRPATFHMTKVVNSEKTELHLCEQCAREKGEMHFSIEPDFSIHQLLAGLLNYSGIDGPDLEPTTEPPVTCGICGSTYEEFTRTGRLGCSHCYEEFESQLEPVIRRVHSATTHTGKAPRRSAKALQVKREIAALRAQLAAAVTREDFERAAQLRDQIKTLEKAPE